MKSKVKDEKQKQDPVTEPVQVDIPVKRRVEMFLVGKKTTLRKFFTEAAEEKLKKEKF